MQKNYLTYPHKIVCFTALVSFGISKWSSFLCLTNIFLEPRVWLFFWTLGMIPTVEDKKISVERALC